MATTTSGSTPPQTPEHSLREALRKFLRDRFDLRRDQAYEGQTLEAVRRDVEFKGANLWILMAAILICSIGLNVNSPAVVIGAMLISPLMGPILGIGVSVAIFDFDLLLSSIKNMGIAMAMSIIVSSLYFAISPITEADSELLARVSPTLWDVLIATFGGFAGIIAISRKEKGNAIPGVAIATALMPPVCTAGYSIATGQWLYFAGSLYLFFINLVFIAFSTFLIVRFMRFGRHKFVDAAQEARVKRWFYTIVALVAIPSVYTAYHTVEDSVFIQRAQRFVDEECDFPDAEVIRYSLEGEGDSGEHVIELVLVGKTVPEEDIQARAARLPKYGLEGVDLIVRQDMDEVVVAPAVPSRFSDDEGFMRMLARNASDLRQRDSTIASLQDKISGIASQKSLANNLDAEAKLLFPALEEARVAPILTSADTLPGPDALLYVRTSARLSRQERRRLGQWVARRTGVDSVLVVD